MSNLIRIENINKDYKTRGYFFKKSTFHSVVKNVSLSIQQGSTLSVVGQSGAGKTTLAKIVSGIIKPTEGTIFYKGKKIGDSFLEFQNKIQMVFQDPYSTLNPMMKVDTILREPLLITGVKCEEKLYKIINDLIFSVGLSESILSKYPHELSGGQRQRVAIARALTLKPELLVCDEPLSSIDPSNRRQIIDVFKNLQNKGISFLIVSHDLDLIKELSDSVIVMLNGEIIEKGSVEDIYLNPQQSYTKELVQNY